MSERKPYVAVYMSESEKRRLKVAAALRDQNLHEFVNHALALAYEGMELPLSVAPKADARTVISRTVTPPPAPLASEG